MRSKILSVILSICMVLTLTPAMAFAAGDDAGVSPQEAATTGGAIVVGSTSEGYSVAESKADGDKLSAAITVTKADLESATIVVTTTTAGIDGAEVSGEGLTPTKVTTGPALTSAEIDKGVTAKVEITVNCSSTTDKIGTVTFKTGEVKTEIYNITVTISKDGGEVPGPGEPTDPELPPVVNTTGGAIEVDKTGMTQEEGAAADEAATAISNGGGIAVDNTDVLKNEIAEKSKEVADSVEIVDADATELGKLQVFAGSTVTADELIPVVLPKININITGAKVDEQNATTSITYNLEYVCQVVLTTDAYKNNAEEGVNAIKKGNEQPLKVTVPVEVTLPLPTAFATALGSSAWVNHDNKNVYPGEVDGTTKKLTFTAKHGFSPFTITAENPSVAQIGADDYYATLQAAVDAVENNGTITILKELTGADATATPSEKKNIKFALSQELKDENKTVKLTIGGNVIDVTANGGSYTPPSSSGGGGGGGGSSATTYTVTVPSSIDHGKITVSPKNASKGNTVTITATPDEGYKVGTITVKDKDGKEIEVKDAGNGKYTFVMPASKVEISATFVEDDGKPTDPTQPTTPSAVTYSDVAETAWYYDAVKYVTEKGLMNGVGNDRFAPNSNLTRAMFAQILYNKAGKPAAGASTFTDVAAGQWYADAVSWAAAQGVVNGIGNGMFGPNNNITREQLAVMLYRYASSPAVTGSVTGFNDAGQISSYAKNAMAWATTNGVMNGKGDGRLDPKGLATRAEVAQMMQNYFK